MGISRPFRRTVRQFVDGHYSEGGRWMYILHPKFAQSPEHYIRGFLILQQDMLKLFDFIEPSDINLSCYSFRIHELLIRTCIEVEANFKAILKENGYNKKGDWNMGDYRLVEQSHRLSSYIVKLPFWHGDASIRRPFSPWSSGGSLHWYQAYNLTKHDRHSAFKYASFGNLIDAMAGLVVLLSAQFYTHDFSPSDWTLIAEGPNDGMESGIGDYFRIAFPNDWPVTERYDFIWKDLESLEDPFDQFPYNNLKQP